MAMRSIFWQIQPKCDYTENSLISGYSKKAETSYFQVYIPQSTQSLNKLNSNPIFSCQLIRNLTVVQSYLKTISNIICFLESAVIEVESEPKIKHGDLLWHSKTIPYVINSRGN